MIGVAYKRKIYPKISSKDRLNSELKLKHSKINISV